MGPREKMTPLVHRPSFAFCEPRDESGLSLSLKVILPYSRSVGGLIIIMGRSREGRGYSKCHIRGTDATPL